MALRDALLEIAGGMDVVVQPGDLRARLEARGVFLSRAALGRALVSVGIARRQVGRARRWVYVLEPDRLLTLAETSEPGPAPTLLDVCPICGRPVEQGSPHRRCLEAVASHCREARRLRRLAPLMRGRARGSRLTAPPEPRP